MMMFSVSEADDLKQKRVLTRFEAITFWLQVDKLTSFIPLGLQLP